MLMILLQGDGAPLDIHPSHLSQQKKNNWVPIKTSKLVPRESKEMISSTNDYNRFCHVFDPVFKWQKLIVSFLVQCVYFHIYSHVQMERIHPNISAQISPWITQLPLNARLPAFPWSGVVLNANIATRAHRDIGDDNYCMVLVTSECKGGDLVFHELGLILAARNGDATVFRSAELTHYNLDFQGTRGSLVFHSDKAGKRWAEDANGWAENAFFS